MKKEKLYYTTLEQSKELYDLGVDPNTADMCYIVQETGDKCFVYGSTPIAIPWRNYTAKEFYIPCWSVGALQEIMKKYNGGICYYSKTDTYEVNAGYNPYTFRNDFIDFDEPIEVIKWLYNNKHIRKNRKNKIRVLSKKEN